MKSGNRDQPCRHGHAILFIVITVVENNKKNHEIHASQRIKNLFLVSRKNFCKITLHGYYGNHDFSHFTFHGKKGRSRVTKIPFTGPLPPLPPSANTRFSRKALGITRQKGTHSTRHHPAVVYCSTYCP